MRVVSSTSFRLASHSFSKSFGNSFRSNLRPRQLYKPLSVSRSTTVRFASSMSTFTDAVKARRTIYALSAESPIPDSRIKEIVEHAVLHVPSSFNSQSTRVVVLLGAEHTKLWSDIVKPAVKAVAPPEAWPSSEQRLSGFQAAYGTVLFYEDPAVVAGLQQKLPLYADRFPQWSEHTNAMHQFTGKPTTPPDSIYRFSFSFWVSLRSFCACRGDKSSLRSAPESQDERSEDQHRLNPKTSEARPPKKEKKKRKVMLTCLCFFSLDGIGTGRIGRQPATLQPAHRRQDRVDVGGQPDLEPQGPARLRQADRRAAGEDVPAPRGARLRPRRQELKRKSNVGSLEVSKFRSFDDDDNRHNDNTTTSGIIPDFLNSRPFRMLL